MEQKSEVRYTYSDYEKWDDGNRWELIDGIPYMMSPAPTVNHQRIIANLTSMIHYYLRGKPCEVFPAPFDVRLDAPTNDDTVVQPDITIVCDPKKIENGKNCMGAPDMVVEILSPSTSKMDREVKFDLYREAGVKEYWIIDPEDRNLTVHLLKYEEYFSKVYGDTKKVPVNILDDCTINLAEVFPPLEPSASPTETTKPPPNVE